jgi:hypothetical protein
VDGWMRSIVSKQNMEENSRLEGEVPFKYREGYTY